MITTKRFASALAFFALCVAAALAAPAAKVLFEDDFESGKAWRPRSKTIQTEIVTDASREGKVMKISGSEEKNWNYAWSKSIAGIEPGKQYSYSLDMLVKDLKAPSVFMKIEISGKGDTFKPTRYSSGKYNILKGGWQTLTCTFTAPEGAYGGTFALEKGTNKPTSIDCLIDNVKLVEGAPAE